MHLSQVDLNLFVVLEAIYREGNLTRAGRQLKLTQPAMSHALKRLRELLKDPLFIREGAHMVPTPFSRNMINDVRQALQILEVNLYENRNFDPAHTRRNFMVGFWELMESTILPSLAVTLSRAAPEISITTLRVKRREIEAELSSGAIDLALDVPINMSDSVRRKPLFSDRVVVVARQGHPAVGRELDLDTYLSQEHILVSSRRYGPSLVDTELNRKGKKRRIVLRCQNYFAACRVASETDMLLTMPEHYAEMLNTRFENRLYPFPLKSLQTLDIHMYWHESADNDPPNRWLREEITKIVDEFISADRTTLKAAPRKRARAGR
ncbi:MAG TPA: LysR family transcriptional regulator [Candidatus Angelobacter sp.]|nr:LysR family transcriptional regulator [Candidatus Angelobacter sp.]